MKHKYYFHRQNAPLDTDHVIYVVWVGESEREQKIMAQLARWSYEHGATFREWSEDVDYYLLYESDRVFPGRGILDFGFVQTHINAKDLLELAINMTFESYEDSLTAPKGYFGQVNCLDPAKIDHKNSQIRKNRVLSSTRKNLSQNAQNDWSLIRFL